MSEHKYVALARYLLSSGQERIRMPFSEIEQLLGFALPVSAYRYAAWWSNGGHPHSEAWIHAGYKTERLNLKEKTVIFCRNDDSVKRAIQSAEECLEMAPVSQEPSMKADVAAKSIELLGHQFHFLQRLSPQKNYEGCIIKDFPQERYINHRNLMLSKHGEGPFCRFSIDGGTWPGVYVWMVDGVVVYIGETENLEKRFNMGYGNISPRNCFAGGQSTNCKMNRIVLMLYEQGKEVEIYFCHTLDHKRIERELIASISPIYNDRG